MNDAEHGRYCAAMQGIVQYAERLRDGRVDGRELSETERIDTECRIARLLTDAIENRKGIVRTVVDARLSVAP